MEGEAKEARTAAYYARGHYLLVVIRIILVGIILVGIILVGIILVKVIFHY